MLGFAAWLRWSPWRLRDHEPAAISDSGGAVVRNGRSRGLRSRLACRLRFGRHREHRRSANREPRAPSLTAAAELPDTLQAIATSTGAVPIEDRRAPSLTADAELPDVLQAPAAGDAAVANADVVTAAESVMA